MSASSIVLKLIIPALALISVGLQFGALNGCDIFRIHFKALNDNGIYFNNDPWVGLGLSSHQTFLGKNTQSWNHDSTCVKYDELETEMFKEGNLHSIELLNIAGIVITMIAAIFSVVRTCCCFVTRTPSTSEKVKEVIFCITIAIIFVTPLSLQAYAFDSLHSDGGICDRDTYYPNAWNENFPFQTYPAYSYFKFFHKCSLGKDGEKFKAAIALHGIIAFMATAIALLDLAFILKSTKTDYVENTLKDAQSRNNGSSLRSMRQKDDEDDGTVSADYPTDVEEN